MSKLLFIGCSKTKKDGRGPALEIYDGPVFRIIRGARDDGHPLPQIVIISKKIGVVGPLTEVESHHWDPPKGEDLGLKAAVHKTFHGLSQNGRVYEEVYIDSSHGFAYLFPPLPTIQILFPDATIHAFIGLKMDIRFGLLKAWLRGQPFPEVIGEGASARFKDGPAERRGRGGASRSTPVYAQPLDEGVRPYMVIESYTIEDLTKRMEASYRQGYRLLSFYSETCIDDVGSCATLYTALMAMPQACLF